MKNRWKIDLRRFWASKPGSGTRRGAFGTRLGRAKAGSRAILGRPGLAKSGRETSKSEPGTVRRRSRARPERCRSVCDATSKVGRVIGTFFLRFCLVARKLRCAVRISFYCVLLGSSDVSSERARATKTLENHGVSASKIEPGSGLNFWSIPVDDLLAQVYILYDFSWHLNASNICYLGSGALES